MILTGRPGAKVRMKVLTSGVVRVTGRLRRLASAYPKATLKEMRVMAEWWAEQSKPMAPVKTSKMQGTMRAFARKERTSLIAGVEVSTDYAIWLAAGTRSIAGGRVMRWKHGMAPITHWQAKNWKGYPNAMAQMPIILPWMMEAFERFVKAMKKGVMRRAYKNG